MELKSEESAAEIPRKKEKSMFHNVICCASLFVFMNIGDLLKRIRYQDVFFRTLLTFQVTKIDDISGLQFVVGLISLTGGVLTVGSTLGNAGDFFHQHTKDSVVIILVYLLFFIFLFFFLQPISSSSESFSSPFL